MKHEAEQPGLFRPICSAPATSTIAAAHRETEARRAVDELRWHVLFCWVVMMMTTGEPAVVAIATSMPPIITQPDRGGKGDRDRDRSGGWLAGSAARLAVLVRSC